MYHALILYSLETSAVEAISDGNNTNGGIARFPQFSEEQKQSVEAIAMDMSPAFVKAAKECIPLAEKKIAHDRFHVIPLANKAVDKFRRRGHKRLVAQGDYRLAKTKYSWLRSSENHTALQESRFL